MELLLILIAGVAGLILVGKYLALADRVQSLESRETLLEHRLRVLETSRDTATSSDLPKPDEWQAVAPARTATPEPPVLSPEPVEENSVAALLAARTRETSESLPPPLPPEQPPGIEDKPAPSPLNWENFLGVKMFAWVGGFVLFLGIAFFIRYSFEHNLIPPALRVLLGFITGIGLVAGGALVKRRAYLVMSQTLCATGILVLYASSFASYAMYGLIGPATVFPLMSLVTAGAFILAARLDARVVGVLGLIGGFLTPMLLSGRQDNPFGLFGYIALLNIGLAALALSRRWHFLMALGAIGTFLMQAGWFLRFFAPEKAGIALSIGLFFAAFYIIHLLLENRRECPSREGVLAAVLQSGAVFILTACFLSYPSLAASPALILGTLLAASLALLAAVWLRDEVRHLHMAGALGAFGLLVWIRLEFGEASEWWGFGAILLFGALYSAFPLLLERSRPSKDPGWIPNLPPIGALLLVPLLLARLDPGSWLIWPAMLVLNVMLLAVAVATASIWAALGGSVITGFLTLLYFHRLPAGMPLTESLLAILFFAGLFSAAVLWLSTRLSGSDSDNLGRRAAPAIPAILPFLLLMVVIARPGPAPLALVFGAALALTLMLLWLARRTRVPELSAAALGASLTLGFCWLGIELNTANAGWTFAFYLVFAAVFLIYPILFRKEFQREIVPWAVAALAGPLFYYPLHISAKMALPDFPAIGLLPAALSLPWLAGLKVVSGFEVPDAHRHRLMAWFGAAALFFIATIFPVQFEKQWITLGWALLGLGLCWLYQRVPHPGLPIAALLLLVTAFVRLGLNPAILVYYPRTGVPIFNWYFYSYGIAALCLFWSARLLAPPRHMAGPVNARAVLQGCGAILLFVLLNIQIADYFGQGTRLRFDFSENLARDMSYSLGWGLFALALLLAGIARDNPPARYASMGLIGITLIKLFVHDLSQLHQLYRIGAFIGVAIILMLASWLYQRYLASRPRQNGGAG